MEYTEYVINRTYNRSKPEVEFHSTFYSNCILKRSGVIEHCCSATRHGVAKINNELVALRLLYTGLFSHNGSHIVLC